MSERLVDCVRRNIRAAHSSDPSKYLADQLLDPIFNAHKMLMPLEDDRIQFCKRLIEHLDSVLRANRDTRPYLDLMVFLNGENRLFLPDSLITEPSVCKSD